MSQPVQPFHSADARVRPFLLAPWRAAQGDPAGLTHLRVPGVGSLRPICAVTDLADSPF